MIDEDFIEALRERGELAAADALLDAWVGAREIVSALPWRPHVAKKTAEYWLRRHAGEPRERREADRQAGVDP